MLPLNRYFVHHIYLPLIGLSLIISECFAYMQKKFAPLAVMLILGIFCLNHGWIAYQDVKSDLYKSWVGDTAFISKNAAKFLKENMNRLSNSSVIYVINETGESLDFAYLGGVLFRFITSLDGLTVTIVNNASEIPTHISENTLIVRYKDKQLFDVTSEFLFRPRLNSLKHLR